MKATNLIVFIVLAIFPRCDFGQLSEPTNQQYDVYSAFLQLQLKGAPDDDLRVGPNYSVISPSISAFRSKLDLHDLALRLSEAEQETLNSLADCTTRPYTLTRKLRLPVEYEFVQKKHTVGRLGYIEFSCVGMNHAGTQAIFSVQRFGCDCAVGKWVLMQRNTGGEWTIKKEVVAWIA